MATALLLLLLRSPVAHSSSVLPHRAETIAGLPQPTDSCAIALAAYAHVTYDFYPPANRTSFGGTTSFHLLPTYSYRYQYHTYTRGDTAYLGIYATISGTLGVEHVVHIPRGLNDGISWYRRLRRHELDHVAISADQRPQLLYRYLLAHLHTIRVPLTPPFQVDDVHIASAIRHEIDLRIAAITTLLQLNYNYLDSLTAHGVVPIQDRDSFFASLYDGPTLLSRGFPYFDDVAPVLATPRYINTPRPRCDD